VSLYARSLHGMTPDLANHHHAITPGRTAALPGDSSWARGTP
jgi:hypothetical protein